MTRSDTDLEAVLQSQLKSLKSFQSATVDHILSKFEDGNHNQRVLVADEVGLGKTIVAKGVIARLLLQHSSPRPLRVVYICSNLALAQENCRKLSLFSQLKDQARYLSQSRYSRLAELAICQPGSSSSQTCLEISTLTPATSFTLTSGFGNRKERLILLETLLKILKPTSEDVCALIRFFHAGHGSRENFENARNNIRDSIDSNGLNEEIVTEFRNLLVAKYGPGYPKLLLGAARSSAGEAASSTDDASLPKNLIPSLRQLLAQACASQLNGDLFILDEFQRFSELLDGVEENESALIASRVFRGRGSGSRILLLSATPFKAMTTPEEEEAEKSHHQSLVRVLDFLDPGAKQRYEPARQELRKQLQSAISSRSPGVALDRRSREAVESVLRPLIARTERSQIQKGFDQVYETVDVDCGTEFRLSDIQTWVSLERLGADLASSSRYDPRPQLMAFYLSSAWPVSFCTGYALQNQIVAASQSKNLVMDPSISLDRKEFDVFEVDITRDAPNPRVRALSRYLLEGSRNREGESGDTSTLYEGPESLLWVPPGIPHYPLKGVFADHTDFTKTLIFSAWAMVPRMMSALLSYEADRRLQSPDNRQARYFSDPAGDHRAFMNLDRTSAAANWALLYPSDYLIKLGLCRSKQSLADLLEERRRRIAPDLASLAMRYVDNDAEEDSDWYFLALPLLDSQRSELCESETAGIFENLIAQRDNQDQKHRLSTLEKRFLDTQRGEHHPGPMPDDLCDWLAQLSIASPAVASYRAMGTEGTVESDRRNAAITVAAGFVGLFNRDTARRVILKRLGIRNADDLNIAREILSYCAEGGIQAMLEEYCHVLRSAGQGLDEQVESLQTVLSMSSSNITAWNPQNKADNTHFSCRYAVPLGTQKLQDQSGQNRVINVRLAFNSPFRPFVLTSTSIGQEGLDFHAYCREVVHWDLPSNPIDLEQREGRVNRYRSLVVRRRLAETFGDSLQADEGWDELYNRASRSWPGEHLVPDWYCPGGKSRINRIVPVMPLGRNANRLDMILKILSLYRLTFGQPGQRELIHHMQGMVDGVDEAALGELYESLMIRLAPVLRQRRV